MSKGKRSWLGRLNDRANSGTLLLGAPTTKKERRKRTRIGLAFLRGGR